MVKITKFRADDAWCIKVDGRPSSLYIVKGSAPKFRNPPTYEVLNGEDYLFECKSVAAAMATIELLVNLPAEMQKAADKEYFARTMTALQRVGRRP